MNIEQTKTAMQVMQAFVDGKVIQNRPIVMGSEGKWTAVTNPYWDFYNFEYRVKPEPRIVYVTEYTDSYMPVSVPYVRLSDVEFM